MSPTSSATWLKPTTRGFADCAIADPLLVGSKGGKARDPPQAKRAGDRRPFAHAADTAYLAACTMISTLSAGLASLASTVARAGVEPGATQASHTSFIWLQVPMSVSQMLADRIFDLSEPASFRNLSILSRICLVWPLTSALVSSAVRPAR